MPAVQLAGLLGLAAPGSNLDGSRLVWDIAAILDEWLRVVSALEWEALVEPTPSRARSTLDLLVNTFLSLDDTIAAWSTGKLDHTGGSLTSGDAILAQREARESAIVDAMHSSEDARAFAAGVRDRWHEFSLEVGDGASDLRRDVFDLWRGSRIPFAGLLAQQRRHAAQHLYQVVTALSSAGAHPGVDPRQLWPDINLPDDPFL